MMYSWQITQLLMQNNYNIDSETYLNICSTSPQLNHIVYNPYLNSFDMWDDTGEHWMFAVYNKEYKGE